MFSAYATLAKSEQADDGTVQIEGAVRPKGKGERISIEAIRKALPGFFRDGKGALRDGQTAAGSVDSVELDEAAGEALVRATIVDPTTVAKFKTGFFKGVRLDGKVKSRQGEVVTGFDWTIASLVPHATARDFSIALAKADGLAKADLICKQALTGDAMEAVTGLSAEDLERHVRSLSGEDRALLLIRLMYGAGRKVKV